MVHEQRARTAVLKSKVEVGETLGIIYDPDNPADARIGTGTDKGLSLFLLVLGIVFIVLGVKLMLS